MKKIFLITLGFIATFVLASCDPVEYLNPEVLEVQLIPSRDIAALDAQRGPLEALLEAELGMEVNATVATDYNGLIEAIESTDIGLKEAIESESGNKIEVLFRAILPEIAPEFMSYTLFRFEINMRAASTLGLVGAGGIGAPLLFSIRSRAWDRTFTIVAVLIVTVTIIDYISGKVRKNLVK